MKRRIILSIALVASIAALSLIKFYSTVEAEPPQKYVWDTGVVTLGTNQFLQVTMISGQGSGDPIPTESISLNYTETVCTGEVCKYAVASQTTAPPLALAPNEAVSIATPPGGTRRIVVLTKARTARVTTSIIDTATGEVVAFTTDLVIDVSG